jgi:hypothetical protein
MHGRLIVVDYTCSAMVQVVIRSSVGSASVLSTSAIEACANVIAGLLDLELHPYLGMDE